MLSVKVSYVLVVAASVITILMIVLALYFINQPLPRGGETLILIDSDGGVDDLMAILILLKAYRVRITAVTTVSGITGANNATRNIRTLLSMVKQQQDIAVFSGRETLPENRSEGYYGWDGLGDFLPPSPLNQSGESTASRAIVDTILQHPGQVILLCIGPLTNLAEALKNQTDLLNNVKRTVLVGASYKGGGNVGTGIEFNMAVDPEAASYVFKMAPKDNPIEVIPVETLESYTSFTLGWRDEVGHIKSNMMEFFNKAENKSLHKGTLWICYDQAGATAIVSPEVNTNMTRGHLSIDSQGAATFKASNTGNVNVMTTFNREILEILLVNALASD